MKTSIRLFVALFVFLFAAQAQAAAPKWELDPAHSGIFFGIKHIYSETRGYFEEFEGDVYFSPDDLAGSRFDFTVEVKSINTSNSKRDGHLNSGDFFDSKKYPYMTFKSSAVRHVQDNRYVVVVLTDLATGEETVQRLARLVDDLIGAGIVLASGTGSSRHSPKKRMKESRSRI